MSQRDIDSKIEVQAQGFLENWSYDWENRCSPDEIESDGNDGSNSIGLDWGDLIDLAEEYTEEMGTIQVGDAGISLSSAIEGAASYMLESRALSAARSDAEEIERRIEDFAEGAEVMVSKSDSLGFMPHESESDTSEGTVCHYRNVEGEGINIDVLHLELGGLKLYIQKRV